VSVFTDKEVAFLKEGPLGRLATVDSMGRPHVVPTGFNVDPDKGVVEIGGHNLPGRGQKRRYLTHIEANPYVAFVVDHVVTEPSWTARGITMRGRAVIHPEGGERLGPGFGPIWVEMVPEWISAWGIDAGPMEGFNSRQVA
jgi:pyridoxamine 5'-phosphate oxidase family protein